MQSLEFISYVSIRMVCSEIEILVNYFTLNTSLFLLLVSLILYVSLVSLVYFIMNYNMIQPFMVKHSLWNYNSVFNSTTRKIGIIVSFTFGSSLLFSCYLFFAYSEDYSLFIESFIITVMLFLVVQSSSFYSPFLLNSLFSVIGFIGFIISIRAFGSSAAVLVVGNLIDVYVFGLIAVMINHTMFIFSYGVVVYSFILYFFLVDVEVLLFLILLLDLSSLVVQSFTLTNRLSLNLIAGSIFSSLLSLALVTLILLLTGIIGFNFMLGAIMSATIYIIINLISILELINLVIQLFIFTLLSQSFLLQLALSGFKLLKFFICYELFFYALSVNLLCCTCSNVVIVIILLLL